MKEQIARVVFVLLGFLPLAVGWFLDYLIMRDPYTFPRAASILLGIGMLLIWFFLGWLSKKFIKSAREAVLFLNTMAVLMIVIHAVQHFIVGAYFANIVGLVTQNFFLSMIALTRILTTPMSFLVISLFNLSFIGFGLMLIASGLGRAVGERQE